VRGEKHITFGIDNALLMDGVVLVYVVIVLAAGALAYRFIDQPSQAYLNGLLFSARDRGSPDDRRAAGS
jgi:peptidoglycan/LPS O-acetylase OafA/YrhL